MNYTNKIFYGNALEQLKSLPDGIAQCCVTSPPYWGLRDYGTGSWQGGDPECDHVKSEIRKGKGIAESVVSVRGGGHKIADVPEIKYSQRCEKCGAVRVDKQIGLEATPDVYISKLVAVFDQVKRVLKDDGTLWLNIGDSYIGGNAKTGEGKKQRTNKGAAWAGNDKLASLKNGITGLKPKDLCMIPSQLAIALRKAGWYLRSEIIWHKPNCMPESVKDRPTNAHEKIFLLSKSKSYYYDSKAIEEPATSDLAQLKSHHNPNNPKYNAVPDERYKDQFNGRTWGKIGTRNKRTVWQVALKPYNEAHFATFPPDLITPCIKAGSKPNDIVLDPFFGSGTTGYVCQRLNRNYLGIELNQKYKQLQQKRLSQKALAI